MGVFASRENLFGNSFLMGLTSFLRPQRRNSQLHLASCSVQDIISPKAQNVFESWCSSLKNHMNVHSNLQCLHCTLCREEGNQSLGKMCHVYFITLVPAPSKSGAQGPPALPSNILAQSTTVRSCIKIVILKRK